MTDCRCKNNTASRGYDHLTFAQRVKLLQYAYYETRKGNKLIWISPYQLVSVPGDPYRGPIQVSTGSGYQQPKSYSGTDGWGATLAPSTMDNLFGSGLSNGLSGYSAREGYCNTRVCSGCQSQCARTNLPTGTRQEYHSNVYQTYGKNAYYCEGCIKNSKNDPSFVNHDSFFYKSIVKLTE